MADDAGHVGDPEAGSGVGMEQGKSEVGTRDGGQGGWEEGRGKGGLSHRGRKVGLTRAWGIRWSGSGWVWAGRNEGGRQASEGRYDGSTGG